MFQRIAYKAAALQLGHEVSSAGWDESLVQIQGIQAKLSARSIYRSTQVGMKTHDTKLSTHM